MGQFFNLNPTFEYILGVVICSALMVLVIKFIQGNCKFRITRFLILSAVLLSILLPLLKIGVYEVGYTFEPTDEYTAPLVSVTTYAETARSLTFQDILFIIYILISTILIIKVIYGIARVVSYKRNSEKELIQNVEIVTSQSIKTPFSFNKTIFLPIAISQVDKEMIVKHEAEHIRLGHSYDKLFMELICCIFWFNPLFMLLKRMLSEVHEFEADDAVVKSGYNVNNYKKLIFDQITSGNPEIANGLVFSLTKKRIIMLTKNNKMGWLRSLAILPAIASAMVLVSFTEKPIKMKSKTEQAKPLELRKDILYIVDNIETAHEKIQFITPDMIESMTVIKDSSATKLYGEKGKNGVVIIKTEPVIYADKSALFNNEDGTQAFAKWCQRNINYPKEAIKQAIQGQVTASFIVEKDGTLSNIKIVKSVDKNLDQAVLDIIANAPKHWTPAENKGEKVRMLVLIPIDFKLQ